MDTDTYRLPISLEKQKQNYGLYFKREQCQKENNKQLRKIERENTLLYATHMSVREKRVNLEQYKNKTIKI